MAKDVRSDHTLSIESKGRLKMSVKLLFTCKLVSVFVLITLVTASNQQPFSLTISGKNAVFEAGKPVHLQLIVKNTSSRDIGLVEVPGDPPPSYQYNIDVHDRDGHPVRMTAYGEKFKPGSTAGSRVTRGLQPGESYAVDLDVTKLFDLRQPGVYVVQAARKIPEYLGAGVVKSNSLTITIK
jgi:hypothetical protein